MTTMTLFQVVILAVFLGCVGAAKWEGDFPLVLPAYLDTVAISCIVKPAGFIGIFKGDEKLETGGRIKVTELFAQNKVELEIQNTGEEDYGKYICKDADGEDEKTVQIEPTLTDVPKDQKAAIGFQGVVQAVVHFMPKKPITWKLNDKEIAVLNAEGTLTKGSDRYNILPRGSLIIKKVALEDAGDYTISVKGTFGYKTKSIKLLVGKKPILQSTPDKVYTVTVGLDLKIPCEWVGAAEPGPTWMHTNKMGVTKKITSGFDSTGLTLSNVSEVMEGNYTCQAENEYGNSSVSAELKHVIIPAALTSEFQNESVVENAAYNLTCAANGSPLPLVTLSKVGGSVLQKEVGMAIYTFKSLSTNDKGTYVCQADNGAKNVDGTSIVVSKSMTLDILTIPVIKREMTTKMIVSAVGLSFQIECSASSNPNPSVKLMKDNKNLAMNNSISADGTVKAYYAVSSAVQSDFGNVECIASNAHGKDNYTITIDQVVKAPAPSSLNNLGDVGLEYIDLKWAKVESADSYIVYVNDTLSEKPSSENEISITGLSRNTYYSFKVASVNIAGVGNASESVILKTSDILIPEEIQNFQTTEISSSDATVTWSKPLNVRDEVIIYYVTYCVVNSTDGDTCLKKDTQDTRTELVDLKSSTTYEISIQPTNQGVDGAVKKFQITTQTDPTVKPGVPSGKKSSGLSAGAVAGVIIAVILIILIVVDLFCCYFNHCGFSHCCFESFCASKGGKKYAPADTKEDEQELKLKTNETV